MIRQKTPHISTGTLALALGATVGAAAAVYFGWRQLRARRAEPGESLPPELMRIEDATVEALRADDIAGHRAIDVAALGAGIIELTGVVHTLEEAHHAVDVAQGVDGVHTVINRMTVGDVEEHLAETRDRLRAGDAALHETKWYGMGVGMGRRRQSSETDPARDDERNRAVSRVLEPDPIAELSEEFSDESGAGAGGVQSDSLTQGSRPVD